MPYPSALPQENLNTPRERVMVCVSDGALTPRVIRAGRQLASSLRGDWVAVYVETPQHYRLPASARTRISRTLDRTVRLGGQTAIVPGRDIAPELLRYARAHEITRIVVGKPYRERWRQVLRSSLADELVRQSGSIGVFIVTADRPNSETRGRLASFGSQGIGGYVFSLLVVIAATALGLVLFPFLDPTNIALIYLLAVVLCATTWGLGPSVFASIVAVLALDALFVPPYGLFSISGAQDLLTLGVFLCIAVVISQLGARIRSQAQAAQRREEQTAALYALTRDIALAQDTSGILDAAVKQIGEVFDVQAVVLLPGADGKLQSSAELRLDETEWRAAQSVFEQVHAAGSGTISFPGAALTFLPLETAQGTLGVLGLRPRGPRIVLTADQRRLLETFAGQIAIALEHEKLSTQAEQAKLLEATDRFRSALLSSISHDLRTPLASIMGSVTSLLDEGAQIAAAARRDLLVTIQEEGARLNRLVGDLLSMTRLESGALKPQRDWHSLEEVVGAALAHRGTDGSELQLCLEPDLPLAPFDFVLIEQVLLNLLDNAFKFSPPGAAVEITAVADGEFLRVSVADNGKGIPVDELERVFDKFYRASQNVGMPGTGLGLSICKGIVEAHGGRIWAERREGGGTRVTFTLPGRLTGGEK